MLSSVYLDAVHKRDATLLALQDSSYKDIVKKAKAGWNEYSPNKVDSKIIGIDASYNSIKYQGLDLWVVTAVAVGADNSVIVDLHDNGLGLMKNSLPLMANRMEIEACTKSHDNADLILMDGTIHSKISEPIKMAPPSHLRLGQIFPLNPYFVPHIWACQVLVEHLADGVFLFAKCPRHQVALF